MFSGSGDLNHQVVLTLPLKAPMPRICCILALQAASFLAKHGAPQGIGQHRQEGQVAGLDQASTLSAALHEADGLPHSEGPDLPCSEQAV